MLFEIFSDRFYEETPCDPSRNIQSKKVPAVVISEPDNDIRDRYRRVLDAIHSIIPESAERYHMLEIDFDKPTYSTSIAAIPSEPFYTFYFKYDNIGKDISTPISGKIILDKFGNITEYKRHVGNKTDVTGYSHIPYNIGTPTPISVDQGPSSICNSAVYTQPDPFVQRRQEDEDKEQSSVCDNESSSDAPPVELSSNSFEVSGSVITVSDPELEIGTVDEDNNSFNIDTDKQRLQDNFLKNMSKKFSDRKS